MRNKIVRHRHSACRRLVSLLQPSQVAALARRLVHHLAETPPPRPEALTLAEFLTLLGLRIETERRRLADAAMRQQCLESDLRALRRDRDEAAGQLRERLVALRRIVLGLFGEAGILHLMGGMSRVPRDAPSLGALGRIVFRHLSRDPADLPEPQGLTARVVRVEPRAMAAGLEKPLVALENALRGLHSRQRHLGAVLGAKDTALARTQALLQPAENLLESLRRLAQAPLR